MQIQTLQLIIEYTHVKRILKYWLKKILPELFFSV